MRVSATSHLKSCSVSKPKPLQKSHLTEWSRVSHFWKCQGFIIRKRTKVSPSLQNGGPRCSRDFALPGAAAPARGHQADGRVARAQCLYHKRGCASVIGAQRYSKCLAWCWEKTHRSRTFILYTLQVLPCKIPWCEEWQPLTATS